MEVGTKAFWTSARALDVAVIVGSSATFDSSKILVNAFAFSIEVHGKLGAGAKAAGFLDRGKRVTFDSIKTIVDAFAFSMVVHCEFGTGAKAAGFFDFSVTLEGRNDGLAMVFCNQRVSICITAEILSKITLACCIVVQI